jgi:catechol 2,3-dioxygenase-like lactoylglutathione lyase family enzyme
MPDSKILDLKAFVPAKDFATSRRFYTDIGFAEKWHNDQVAEFEAGGFRFLLQNFYVKELAENFMMQLHVNDADVWWKRISGAKLKERYDFRTAKPPSLQPWGLRVLYISDPSGVLWHIADTPAAK